MNRATALPAWSDYRRIVEPLSAPFGGLVEIKASQCEIGFPCCVRFNRFSFTARSWKTQSRIWIQGESACRVSQKSLRSDNMGNSGISNLPFGEIRQHESKVRRWLNYTHHPGDRIAHSWLDRIV